MQSLRDFRHFLENFNSEGDDTIFVREAIAEKFGAPILEYKDLQWSEQAAVLRLAAKLKLKWRETNGKEH